MKPSRSDFDGWKNSAVGVWYFAEYLKESAREAAEQIGYDIGGLGNSWQEDYLRHVMQAGRVQGIQAVIDGVLEENDDFDPFSVERKDDETKSGRKVSIG